MEKLICSSRCFYPSKERCPLYSRGHFPIFIGSQQLHQPIRLPLLPISHLQLPPCCLPAPRGRPSSLALIADKITSRQDSFADCKVFALKSSHEASEHLTTGDANYAPKDCGHKANAHMRIQEDRQASPTEANYNSQKDVSVGNEPILTYLDIILNKSKQKIRKRKIQQLTYLFAALASSVGITSLAAASVYYRFAWQIEGRDLPWTEIFGTFSLALGAAVGMEYWARWAHRTLWHASLWSMHKSHHRPRDGPFELNDIFAIINAVPAIALMAFGFLHKGLVPGLCFGAGLGITTFGIAYMFIHDGLVHQRFPVGPIADVPYFQKVAAAHQLHHTNKFNGVPYGLFLGPLELEEVGGQKELEMLLKKRISETKNSIKCRACND